MSDLDIFIIESSFREDAELEFITEENDESKNLQLTRGETKDAIPIFIPGITFDNYNETLEKLKREFDVTNINIYFVDTNYNIKYYYTDDGKREYKNFLEIAKREDSKIYSCRWESFISEFLFYDENSYIFITQERFKNKYEMAAQYDIRLNSNSFLLYDIKEFSEVINCQSPLNIFSWQETGRDSRDRNFEIDQSAINSLLREGVEHCKIFISAGFLDGESFIQKEIPSWSLNVENLFVKLVILQNRMEPKKINYSEDEKGFVKTMQEYFNESALFRQRITQNMCLTLYNYAKKNFDGIPDLPEKVFSGFSEKGFFEKTLKYKNI